jgi:hypothetical protein
MSYENANVVDRGSNLFEIIYDNGDHFWVQIIQRNEPEKATQFKYTPIFTSSQTAPASYSSPEWRTDAQLEADLEEEMKGIDDPFTDFIWWLLRMLARRSGRPFG